MLKNLEFLKEMRQKLIDGYYTDLEQMIVDWIDELETELPTIPVQRVVITPETLPEFKNDYYEWCKTISTPGYKTGWHSGHLFDYIESLLK